MMDVYCRVRSKALETKRMEQRGVRSILKGGDGNNVTRIGYQKACLGVLVFWSTLLKASQYIPPLSDALFPLSF
jgi:hypothetical protein